MKSRQYRKKKKKEKVNCFELETCSEEGVMFGSGKKQQIQVKYRLG